MTYLTKVHPTELLPSSKQPPPACHNPITNPVNTYFSILNRNTYRQVESGLSARSNRPAASLTKPRTHCATRAATARAKSSAHIHTQTHSHTKPRTTPSSIHTNPKTAKTQTTMALTLISPYGLRPRRSRRLVTLWIGTLAFVLLMTYMLTGTRNHGDAAAAAAAATAADATRAAADAGAGTGTVVATAVPRERKGNQSPNMKVIP
jgi:hypothetical protein